MEQDAVNYRRKIEARTALVITMVCAFMPLVCLGIPLYVIRPFRPQGEQALALALAVRNAGPWISAVCVIVALVVALWAWKSTECLLVHVALVMFSIIAIAGACLTPINIFEIMFHPYNSPTFGDWDTAKLDSRDMVLAVRIGNQDHAYPIRIMGYHHIVNDTVGGVPIAVTYCTLCHTGLIWKRVLDGMTLYFRLAGINNGNALMRDEQTGSIWQQSTGQAIFGPLKGRQLELVHSDEMTAALWHEEEPQGQILKPYAPYAAEYETRDWEKHVEKTRTVVDTKQSGIPPHELMLGVSIDGMSKAYPIQSILAEKLIQDQIAGEPVLIVVGPDQTSIRVFQRPFAGKPAASTFIRKLNSGLLGNEQVMIDTDTGSIWNFQGCAIEGEQASHCLKEIDANKDYWFDWLNHHPATAVFKD